MIAAFLLALATYAAPTPQVDRIEVNHYSAPNCKHEFTQLIFWQWSEQRKRYDVRAWKLVSHESQLPILSQGRYIVRYHEDGQLREIVARNMTTTHTPYDPELREREHLPQDQRRGIFE